MPTAKKAPYPDALSMMAVMNSFIFVVAIGR